jgi:hypothetical protein
MIFHNVDHISVPEIPELPDLSRSASSLFLAAASDFWLMLSHLEKQDFPMAADIGKRGDSKLDQAALAFHKISGLIQGHPWLRREFRSVDLGDAARSIGLPPRSESVSLIGTQIANGDIHEAFKSCARNIESLSAKLTAFVELVIKSAPNPSALNLHIAHEIIRDLSVLTTQGQFVSAACHIMGTVTQKVRA